MPSINKIRSFFYGSAKFLGDVQAIRSGSPKKITKRILRRGAGKITSRGLGKIFK